MMEFFLRLFKADTLRRLHIYLSDILKYAAKSWILNQGAFLKASHTRDKNVSFLPSRREPAVEQGSLHVTVWASCTIDSKFCFGGGRRAGAHHHLWPTVGDPPPTRALGSAQ